MRSAHPPSLPLKASLGTHALLGLKNIKMTCSPTTLYFMLGERCLRNCSYCAQRNSSGGIYLSRVMWPPVAPEEVERGMETAIKRGARRICVQTLDYPHLLEDLRGLSNILFSHIPVSLSIPPLSEEEMLLLKEMGVEIAAVSLDAATEEIFTLHRGAGVGNPYTWEGMWEAMRRSREIFGSTVTHVIVGLGESDEDLLRLFEKLKVEGVYPALFAFTPLPSTPLSGISPPPLGRYRAVQLMHHLIFHMDGEGEGVLLEGGRIVGFRWEGIEDALLSGNYMRTSGCGWCNRPYYNESPRGPLYNHPAAPSPGEIRRGMDEMRSYGVRTFEG
ncbi:MAG: radical SAM protein [Thermoplasmata archaeon]|nr:MAG: radical SAM protein [Thermoplasmata archaeon]